MWKKNVFKLLLFILIISGFLLNSPNIRSVDKAVNFTDSHLKIKGIYGGTWEYEDISDLKLVYKLPEFKGKSFGKANRVVSQGHFTFKNDSYEKGMLHVYNEAPPYLFIEFRNRKSLFINSKDETVTEEWYSKLKKEID